MLYSSGQINTYWRAFCSGWTFVYIGLLDAPKAQDLRWMRSIPEYFTLLVACGESLNPSEMLVRLTDHLQCSVALWRFETLYFDGCKQIFDHPISPKTVTEFIFDLYQVPLPRHLAISWPDECDTEAEEKAISALLERVRKSSNTRAIYARWARKFSNFQKMHSFLSISEIQRLPMQDATRLLERFCTASKLNPRQHQEALRMLKKLVRTE